jgi:oxygen-independent coproporphyrinogen-3 oxidase
VGEPTAIYVHLPFCLRKCAYCDFNSRPGSEAERGAYLEALLREIAGGRAEVARAGAATVYFGGGTPTLYGAGELVRVLDALRARHGVTEDAEVSLEANPGTVATAGGEGCELGLLRAGGFNRISLGMQSFRDDELRLLGRVHSASQAAEAFTAAREAGFVNVSLDLMRGLPGQFVEQWQESVERAVELGSDHVSVYGLSLEEGTPLRAQVECGELPEPEGSDDPEWVRWTVGRLAEAELGRYEISNYARPGFECRHNLVYWRNEPYIGYGAGAWSYVGCERRRNLSDPARYIEGAGGGGELVEEAERLDADAALGETLMLGLRLVEGVSLGGIRQRFGVDVRERFAAVIARFEQAGLLVVAGDRLRLTDEGLLWQNAVAAEFVA